MKSIIMWCLKPFRKVRGLGCKVYYDIFGLILIPEDHAHYYFSHEIYCKFKYNLKPLKLKVK